MKFKGEIEMGKTGNQEKPTTSGKNINRLSDCRSGMPINSAWIFMQSEIYPIHRQINGGCIHGFEEGKYMS
jgi:hypothetical protein